MLAQWLEPPGLGHRAAAIRELVSVASRHWHCDPGRRFGSIGEWLVGWFALAFPDIPPSGSQAASQRRGKRTGHSSSTGEG